METGNLTEEEMEKLALLRDLYQAGKVDETPRRIRFVQDMVRTGKLSDWPEEIDRLWLANNGSKEKACQIAGERRK